MTLKTDENKKFVTLILREKPDYEGMERSGWRYFDIDPHHGSVWEMECPELGFSGGFYTSRDTAIDEAFLMMPKYAIPFTVTSGMPPEYVAARAALLNTPKKYYAFWSALGNAEARQARTRFESAVRIIDGELFSREEIRGWHERSGTYYQRTIRRA